MRLPQLSDELTRLISQTAGTSRILSDIKIEVSFNEEYFFNSNLQNAFSRSTNEEKMSLFKMVLSEIAKKLKPDCKCHTSNFHFILTHTIFQEGCELLVLWQQIPSIANIKNETFDMEFDNNGVLYIRGQQGDIAKYIDFISSVFDMDLAIFTGQNYSNTRIYMS